jgi:virulence-associated protein VagC
LHEGQRIRIIGEKDRIIIKPVKDAIWLVLHGENIGKIMPEEVEEESMIEQKNFRVKKVSFSLIPLFSFLFLSLKHHVE